jgi:hypothetical protein
VPSPLSKIVFTVVVSAGQRKRLSHLPRSTALYNGVWCPSLPATIPHVIPASQTRLSLTKRKQSTRRKTRQQTFEFPGFEHAERNALHGRLAEREREQVGDLLVLICPNHKEECIASHDENSFKE